MVDSFQRQLEIDYFSDWSLRLAWSCQLKDGWSDSKCIFRERIFDTKSNYLSYDLQLSSHLIFEKTELGVTLKTQFLNQDKRRPFKRYIIYHLSAGIDGTALRFSVSFGDDVQCLRILDDLSTLPRSGKLQFSISIAPDCATIEGASHPLGNVGNDLLKIYGSLSRNIYDIFQLIWPKIREIACYWKFIRQYFSQLLSEFSPSESKNGHELPSNENYKDLLNLPKNFSDKYPFDVTLMIEGKKLRVHKMMLAMHSPVFCEMFAPGLTQETLVVKSVNFDTMYHVLRFLYAAVVPQVDDRELGNIILAANRYGMLSLRTRCLRILQHQMSPQNAIEVLRIADSCEAEFLTKKAVELIVKHFTKFSELDIATLESRLVAKILTEIMSD